MTTPIATHSTMYAYLLDMYLRGVLTDPALDAAVTKRWITAAEASEIRATKAARDAAIVAAADAAIASTLVEDPATPTE